LAILRSRAGRYPVSPDWVDDGVYLEVVLAADPEDDNGVTLGITTWWNESGVDHSRSDTSSIRADRDGSLTVERTTPQPTLPVHALRLALRESAMDGFRWARFIFGMGDIEDDRICEEILLELRADGGLAYAHAWGQPGDPFSVRTMTSFAAPGITARYPSRAPSPRSACRADRATVSGLGL
jgi:hypothetical protein